MAAENRKWYTVYTKPRCEKKVYGRMLAEGIEAYCPLNKVHKKWSDRMKWVEEPLFKSYVFVRMTDEEQGRIRMITGVVNFVYWLGKPAIVRDKEIEIIRKFLDEYDEVQAVPLEIQADARVRIQRGAFMDKEAKVVKVLNNKVQVIIESIGYSLVAVIDKSNISMSRI